VRFVGSCILQCCEGAARDWVCARCHMQLGWWCNMTSADQCRGGPASGCGVELPELGLSAQTTVDGSDGRWYEG
jgi:hypothetical protein